MASPKHKRQKPKANAGGSLLGNRSLQILFFLFILSSVFLFYKFAGSKEDFITKTKELKNSNNQEMKQGLFQSDEDLLEKEKEKIKNHMQQRREEYKNDFYLFLMFTNVEKNPELKGKLSKLLNSIARNANFSHSQILHINIVTDDAGKKIAKEIADSCKSDLTFHMQVHFHDSDEYSKKVFPIVEGMQKHFGNHAYYKDSIFFLSIAMHRILPKKIHKIVQLDLDLKVDVNIRDIWEEFDYFTDEKIVGLAYENQPVYRQIFWRYRKENPGTKVGSPVPHGIPGFNSGVILLHLEHMRNSEVYNKYLQVEEVENLAKKYYFKGHLGDQDFFTLLSLDHPELFHVLECTWNRQLCQWWKNKGHDDVFDQYFNCNGKVKIWHGNCNTPIP